MNICNTARFVHNGSQNISQRTRSVCEWVLASSIYCVTAQRETTFCPGLWLATKPGAISSIRQRNKRVWNGDIPALLAQKKLVLQFEQGKWCSCVFFEENGLLMLEWLETGGTVNANRFCNTLRKLKTAIKNCRCGQLSKGGYSVAGQCPSSCGKSLQRSDAALPMGSSPSPPLQPQPVTLRFPPVRATKKSTEGTPVHRQRWGLRNRWRMVPHATQDFLRWQYPSSRGQMGHLFQPTRRLCVDSTCYTDIVYVPLFNL